MKMFIFLSCYLFGFLVHAQNSESEMVIPSDYLSELKTELQKEWPKNRTINITVCKQDFFAQFTIRHFLLF